jgi:hypothetical protein
MLARAQQKISDPLVISNFQLFSSPLTKAMALPSQAQAEYASSALGLKRPMLVATGTGVAASGASHHLPPGGNRPDSLVVLSGSLAISPG